MPRTFQNRIEITFRLVDRSTRAFDLIDRSPYGAALTPLGRAPAYISRTRNDSVYTFYKIDWSVYDTLRTRAGTR